MLKIRKCLTIISVDDKENWSSVPEGGKIPGETFRLSVGRKLTLT
jgi:hypothetical protein